MAFIREALFSLVSLLTLIWLVFPHQLHIHSLVLSPQVTKAFCGKEM